MSWQKKAAAVFTAGRKLEDDGLYVIGIFDLEPAGILIRAYNQATSAQYTLSPSELELTRAGLCRSDDDLKRLADSIQLYRIGTNTFIHSTLPGISKPKVVPLGDAAKDFIAATPAGPATSLPELLATALSELCKVKPQGLDAVQWLGEWLLANNPNQPTVQEPDCGQ
ncbi:unnamed protein product [Phaeothamnion confervicola]